METIKARLSFLKNKTISEMYLVKIKFMPRIIGEYEGE